MIDWSIEMCAYWEDRLELIITFKFCYATLQEFNLI